MKGPGQQTAACEQRASEAAHTLENKACSGDELATLLRSASHCDLAGFSYAWALDLPARTEARINWISDLSGTIGQPPDPTGISIWMGQPYERTGFGAWPSLLPWLTCDERARMLRFRFAIDRWSYGAAHAALRVLLAPRLGCSPLEVHFDTESCGKPVVSSAVHGQRARELHFNISHTRGLVAVALSRSPVGIDVEPLRPLPDLTLMARTHMGHEAQDSLAREADEAARTALFFRYWTLGEAFIKATGQGLKQGLATFAFSPGGAPRLTRVTPGWGAPERWQFGHGGGYLAARH